MINSAEGYAEPDALTPSTDVAKTTKTRLKLKLFEHETEKRYEQERIASYSELDIEDRLTAVLDTLRSKGHERVLLIVDELDRVRDTSGLASFIKNTSSDTCKFMLVGVANSLSTLLADHESIQRTLYPVRVPRMSQQELRQIVRKTALLLRENGVDIAFDKKAMDALVRAANGFPWFVHLLGQDSLVRAWDGKRNLITEEDISQAISRVAKNRFAQQFSDTYNAAVRNSPQRETVLRLLAKWTGDDIYLSEIYPVAKGLGISNPSVSKKDFTLKRYGSIIEIPPLHERGVVRFQNSMFKQYVNLRHSVYSGVKDRVEQAWESKRGS